MTCSCQARPVRAGIVVPPTAKAVGRAEIVERSPVRGGIPVGKYPMSPLAGLVEYENHPQRSRARPQYDGPEVPRQLGSRDIVVFVKLGRPACGS